LSILSVAFHVNKQDDNVKIHLAQLDIFGAKQLNACESGIYSCIILATQCNSKFEFTERMF